MLPQQQERAVEGNKTLVLTKGRLPPSNPVPALHPNARELSKDSRESSKDARPPRHVSLKGKRETTRRAEEEKKLQTARIEKLNFSFLTDEKQQPQTNVQTSRFVVIKEETSVASLRPSPSPLQKQFSEQRSLKEESKQATM